MKIHLLPKFVSALLLLGMAAFAQGAPRHNGSGEPQGTSVQQAVQAIIQTSHHDNGLIPQLTAQLIVSSSENIQNAAAIAAAVTKTTGVKGDLIATAIAKEFARHPELVAQAPAIAKAMVEAILAKGLTPATQAEIANTVAALSALLPGTAQANQATIVAIAKEVSPLLANSPETAAMVVGETISALKVSSGSSDVSAVLSGFADTFKTGNTSLNSQIDTIVSNVNAGQIYNLLPTSTGIVTVGNGLNTPNNNLGSGSVTTPETNVVNP